MAENVQFNIENSIQELEQLKRVGLFSDAEVRKVIRKRKNLEYKLAKMFKRKEDYLKYIQYEIGLLNLIRIRREKLRYFHKKSEIDNSIGKRINYIFKGAIRKFPEDIKLWFSHHDFLKKMHWQDSISKMGAHMLQIHNKSPELWVTCAKWEVEDNNSIDNARKLFQRALRFHPKSELVWKEYFRLELMYVDQLLKRRKVLGIQEQDDDEVDDNVLKGKVPVVVYNNAVKQFDDVNLALAFIPISKEFDFTAEIIDMIFRDVESRFPNKEETLNALAERCMDRSNEDNISSKKFLRTCIDDAVIKYEDAVRTLRTEKMWDYFIQFLLNRIHDSKSEKKMKKLVQQVLDVMEQASDEKLLSHKMHIEWIKLLYTGQDLNTALEVAHLASTRFPDDPLVWQFSLTLHAQSSEEGKFMEVFHRAVSNVRGKNSLPFWKIAVEWATCANSAYIQEIFESGIMQVPEVQIPMKHLYLKVTSLLLGIDETRSLYDRLKKMPPLSLEFFETMVDAEKAQQPPNVKKMKGCYEDAIMHLGDTSPDLWLNYISMIEKNPNGHPGQIGKIYWRAMKQLQPEFCNEFTNKHTLRFKKTDENQLQSDLEESD